MTRRIQTIVDLGERALIRRLAGGGKRAAGVAVGIGDDCAVVRLPGAKVDLLYTTDAVIEGIHFHPGTPPARIGHKAAGRALSDIAAMGGDPRYLLVNLVARPDTPLPVVDGIYRGMRRLLARHGAAIIGGDTARGPGLEVHVFGVGTAPRGTAVRRAGARPGHVLFVTGTLGGSLRGRHLAFPPRVDEGRWLRRGGWASAMIDLSDGLATDLPHLAEACGVGARLDPARIPVSAAARRMADGRAPLDHALRDGEDYELLFAVSRRRAGALPAAWRRAFRTPLTAVGDLVRKPGVWLAAAGRPPQRLAGAAYEHFTAGQTER
jgi:thiamine-monophosphate kinase